MISQTEPQQFIITLTEEATNRLLNIVNHNKTPIIKIENRIYHPKSLLGIFDDESAFYDYINNQILIIYPYGYEYEPTS